MQTKYSSYLFLALVLTSASAHAQHKKNVLFLGNSYTYVNDLPQTIASIAASTGDTLMYDSHAPGGYYLGEHVSNTTSLSKIATGNRDFVVLQDQSMALAYPSTYLNHLPYSKKLDSIIKAENECAQVIFYSTWGRKNGDMYVCNPPECDTYTVVSRTYYEMDSAIGTHYKTFADSIKAGVSPVGAVWRYIRRNHTATELHQADESHPSMAGTYAAACSFYSAIFRKDPTLITNNMGLPAIEAANIRTAAKAVVYDHLLSWNIGAFDTLLNIGCLPPATNIPPITGGQFMTVTPNPATDHLMVTAAGKDVLGVFDAVGKLVKEIQINGSTSIDVSYYPSGLYIIRSTHTGSVVKVLKQ